jgi:hypothetical protein
MREGRELSYSLEDPNIDALNGGKGRVPKKRNNIHV